MANELAFSRCCWCSSSKRGNVWVQVQKVLFASQLKYVLIICDNTRQELELLQPAISQAEACSGNGEIVGCIVSLLDGAIFSCVTQVLMTAPDKDVSEPVGRRHAGGTICSRFFAPWAGIPEDPVTGSAHSVLAAYYCAGAKQQSMPARQCSKRGGDLHVSLRADCELVDISGQAVTTIAGTMYVP